MQPPATSSPPSFDRFRSYLLLLARWQWNPRLQGKLDPSDVVQQALVQAWQGRSGFRGETDAELRGWLRRVLTNCLADAARNYSLDKRDLAKDCSLDAMLTNSSARLEGWLDDQQSSPQQRAERNEQLVQLAQALAELPDAQQQAVTLFHLHGLSVAEIGTHLGRSESAVAGLLKRGLHALRLHFKTGA